MATRCAIHIISKKKDLSHSGNQAVINLTSIICHVSSAQHKTNIITPLEVFLLLFLCNFFESPSCVPLSHLFCHPPLPSAAFLSSTRVLFDQAYLLLLIEFLSFATVRLWWVPTSTETTDQMFAMCPRASAPPCVQVFVCHDLNPNNAVDC